MKRLLFILFLAYNLSLITHNSLTAQWVKLNSGTKELLGSICFTDANAGYVVGYGGTILKTIVGGWTEANELHIYTNPANEILNVEFLILNKEYVSIKIIDIYGVEIKEIKVENNQTGKCSLKVDTKYFKDGIYFIQLSTGSNTIIKKIIIIH